MLPDWHLMIGDAPALPAIVQCVQTLPPLARVAVIVAGDTREAHCLHAGAAEPHVICCDDGDGVQKALCALYIPDGVGMVQLYGEARTCAGLRRILGQRTRRICRIEQYPSRL